MKNTVFGLVILFFALLSCRGNSDDIQIIDQTIDLYIKNSAGKDLLNPKDTANYISLTYNDLYGEFDNSPLNSFSLKKTQDSIYYLQYVAGAKRKLVANLSNDQTQIYESLFTIKFNRKNALNSDFDTVKIQYENSSPLFQVSKVWYNNQLTFTKISGQPNIVKVVK